MATLLFDIETIANSSTDNEAALSPATAQIALLGVYDLDSTQGTVYVTGESVPSKYENSDWRTKIVPEASLLTDFWSGLDHYDVFVTFNGRRFDVPFLTHRSLTNNVRPSNRLRNQRVLSRQSLPFHVDLFDEFSFDNNMTKPLSLRALCQMYNISYECLSYNQVAEYVGEGKNNELVKHMKNKLEATAVLFEIWRNFLAPPHFLNTIEL